MEEAIEEFSKKFSEVFVNIIMEAFEKKLADLTYENLKQDEEFIKIIVEKVNTTAKLHLQQFEDLYDRLNSDFKHLLGLLEKAVNDLSKNQ